MSTTPSPQERGEGDHPTRIVIVERQIVAIVPGKRAISDPDLRDRLYELLEHDHLPHSVGSRFAQLIVAIIVLDVLAMILASVPEFDARFGWLFTIIEVSAVVAFALEYAGAAVERGRPLASCDCRRRRARLEYAFSQPRHHRPRWPSCRRRSR